MSESAVPSRGGPCGGQAVAITGASSGLGAALAEEFARAGADVALFARRRPELEAVAERCRRHGARAVVVAGDVTRYEDCERLIEDAAEQLGGVDCVVANSGISMWARFDEVEDISLFKQLMDVNYLGVVHTVHAALQALLKSRGMIVVVSSVQGCVGVPFHTGYAASKFALHGFVESLRLELEGTGVDTLIAMPYWMRGTELRGSALSASGGEVGTARRQHSRGAVDVQECARRIVAATARRERQLTIPGKLRFLPLLKALAPRLTESIVRRKMRREDARGPAGSE